MTTNKRPRYIVGLMLTIGSAKTTLHVHQKVFPAIVIVFIISPRLVLLALATPTKINLYTNLVLRELTALRSESEPGADTGLLRKVANEVHLPDYLEPHPINGLVAGITIRNREHCLSYYAGHWMRIVYIVATH